MAAEWRAKVDERAWITRLVKQHWTCRPRHQYLLRQATIELVRTCLAARSRPCGKLRCIDWLTDGKHSNAYYLTPVFPLSSCPVFGIFGQYEWLNRHKVGYITGSLTRFEYSLEAIGAHQASSRNSCEIKQCFSYVTRILILNCVEFCSHGVISENLVVEEENSIYLLAYVAVFYFFILFLIYVKKIIVIYPVF